MDIKNCTHTRGGRPWRFYADDGGGPRPIHGAYYKEKHGWVADTWNRRGEKYQNYRIVNELDLDLTDWRDQIPWDQLIDEVIYVTWDPLKEWIAWLESPIKGKSGWIRVPSSSSGSGYGLGIIKMPQPPTDWRQAIARRPDQIHTG